MRVRAGLIVAATDRRRTMRRRNIEKGLAYRRSLSMSTMIKEALMKNKRSTRDAMREANALGWLGLAALVVVVLIGAVKLGGGDARVADNEDRVTTQR
jgi:hypothetical protein